MLAVALDDFSVLIIDSDLKRIVRKFSGHSNRISDMAFSTDSRWIITASMDCLIKVWDLPSSKLIDCFKFDKAPTSICFSPSSEFFATTHVNDLGIYLWSNKTLYSHVSFRQLPDDYEPLSEVKMPTTSSPNDPDETEEMDQESGDLLDDYKHYVSPEQLAFDLVTLSLMPESRWKNLVNLDIIKVGYWKNWSISCLFMLKNYIFKQRNKPKEPPKVPKLAPFFLPTVANEQGFTFKAATDSKLSESQVWI